MTFSDGWDLLFDRARIDACCLAEDKMRARVLEVLEVGERRRDKQYATHAVFGSIIIESARRFDSYKALLMQPCHRVSVDERLTRWSEVRREVEEGSSGGNSKLVIGSVFGLDFHSGPKCSSSVF